MNNEDICNLDKLPKYFVEVGQKRVCVIGCGAVGSIVVELLVKIGIKKLYLIDFDNFEKENIYKSSSIYDIECDAGKNKAIVLADRINSIFGMEIHGIASSVTNFGPGVLASFDVIILALDNYAAKIYVNQIWKTIPDKDRPLLVFGGTFKDIAQCYGIDGSSICLRDTVNEELLKNPLIRASCTGINYKPGYIISEHIRTSVLASMTCAVMMVDACKNYILNKNYDLINKDIVYNSLQIRITTQVNKKICYDCIHYHPINDVRVLGNLDVFHSTVGDLLDEVTSDLGSLEYEICAPIKEFANVEYKNIIKSDYCACCGTKLHGIYKHEFSIRYSQLLCDHCRNENKIVGDITKKKDAECIMAFTIDCDEELKCRTLYDIGFGIGSYITVKCMGPGTDAMDRDINIYTYCCGGDVRLLDVVTEMED